MAPILNLRDKAGNPHTTLDLSTISDADLALLQTQVVAERRQRSRVVRTAPARPLEDMLRHFSVV